MNANPSPHAFVWLSLALLRHSQGLLDDAQDDLFSSIPSFALPNLRPPVVLCHGSRPFRDPITEDLNVKFKSFRRSLQILSQFLYRISCDVVMAPDAAFHCLMCPQNFQGWEVAKQKVFCVCQGRNILREVNIVQCQHFCCQFLVCELVHKTVILRAMRCSWEIMSRQLASHCERFQKVVERVDVHVLRSFVFFKENNGQLL